jgi:glycosyltransferase involved in cell wall biosynthesis
MSFKEAKIIAIDIREAGAKSAAGKGVYNLELTKKLIQSSDYKWILLTDSRPVDAELQSLIDANPNIELVRISGRSVLWHLQVRKYLLKNPVEIYLGMTSYLTPYFLKGNSNLKVFIFVHDLICFLHSEDHPTKPTIIENFALPNIINSVAKVFTVSNNTKLDLLTLFPHINESKVLVAPCAANANPEKSTTAKKSSVSPYILSVSSLLPRKNFHTLIQAFNKVKGLIPHQLIIVGGEADKKYAAYLKSLVLELELEDRVLFKGFVEPAELSSLYSQADFAVYPSKYEGFGIPILEAYSYECPVLVSNRSSLPEVAAEAGQYFNPDSADDLAQQILNMSKDKYLKEAIINKSKLRLAYYSWNKTAQIVLNAIERG